LFVDYLFNKKKKWRKKKRVIKQEGKKIKKIIKAYSDPIRSLKEKKLWSHGYVLVA